jgi:hypothetical protein
MVVGRLVPAVEAAREVGAWLGLKQEAGAWLGLA